jgi:CBS domain containing-hemolysin-like protein
VLTEWLLVLLGVVLTAGTAVFVASEFSLVTLDPGVVEGQTRPDDRRGQSVLKALRRLSTELSGCGPSRCGTRSSAWPPAAPWRWC